jgi:hypothetical protein
MVKLRALLALFFLGYLPFMMADTAAQTLFQTAQSTTCFFSHEQTSGMNKICYYDCLGSQAAITVSAVQLCPLSIRR